MIGLFALGASSALSNCLLPLLDMLPCVCDCRSSTPDQWEDFSNVNILNAEKQRQNSVSLRSIIDGTSNDSLLMHSSQS